MDIKIQGFRVQGQHITQMSGPEIIDEGIERTEFVTNRIDNEPNKSNGHQAPHLRPRATNKLLCCRRCLLLLSLWIVGVWECRGLWNRRARGNLGCSDQGDRHNGNQRDSHSQATWTLVWGLAGQGAIGVD